MRIFVTGTGRCGTVTFSKAAAHITNYTSGHESHMGRVGDLNYPEWHIEIDPHLVHVMPLLLDKYPEARWVHLVRTERDCRASLAKRATVKEFCRYAFMAPPAPERCAGIQYRNTNRLIELLAPDALRVHLEMMRAADWRRFWLWAGAEGDFEASVKEWDTRYNASEG